MEEWKESIIEQTSIQMIDGDRGKNYPKNSDFFSQGYCLFLNAGNVTKSGFSFSDNAFITEDKDQLLRKGRLERNDVVITTRGTVGNVALYDSSVPYEHIRINSGMLILKGGRDILPEYLYYFLKGSRFQTQIDQFVSGSAQPQLPKSTLGKMKISFPVELNVQKRICGVLKSLDDKIEVNRRINDNLEQQAQALFKSWFVDFEPFRDQPFVESELGMIPEGWRVVSFKDFIEVSTEKAPVDCYPEYSVTNNGIIPRNTKFNKKLSKSSSKNKVLKKNDLVFGMSREILNWGIMEDEVGGVSSAYNVYKIDMGIVSPTYLRLYMKARISDFNSLIGTAAREGQSLDKGQLLQKQIYIPTIAALQDFLDLFLPITETQLNYLEESRRLAELRDTLLPRLMSGEIKVGDVTL